ncbi:MAG: hypothetical protein BAJALOKI2v1_550021 [Promethearchaeota archaeon]|nr:MAG: hypothetical protein BAJALOKI2v1_550021 [Candidatus Lokiarchaeota archaeon]
MAKKKSKKNADKKEEKTEEPKPEKITHKKIKVDFWRTSLHGEELGLYQEMKYQAKTTYFSKSFEIEGVVEVDGEKKFIIAFNKDEWESRTKEDPKTLVLRLFTIMEEDVGVGSGGNFKGSLELSIAHSLVQSYEVRRPAAVFFMQLPRNVNFIRIVEGYRLIGTRWSYPLLPEKKDDKLQMVECRGTIGMGENFNVYMGKKKIARIDGQRVQKEFEIEIYDEFYANDKEFVRYLMLFGCACNFIKDTRKMIKRLYKGMEDDGTTEYRPPKREMDLFKNPRLMRK